MAPQPPLFILGLPESSETREEFSARAAAGQLTQDDFKHFLAYLYWEETPTALADLTPTAVEDTEPTHDLEGRHLLYSFSDHDASTILQRWYSDEEKMRHDQTRLAVIEKANKSGKAVEKAYQDFIRVAGELKTRNAEVHHPQGKWAILPMAFVAFWWMFM